MLVIYVQIATMVSEGGHGSTSLIIVCKELTYFLTC